MPYAHPVACAWPLGEAWKGDVQAEAGHSKVEEWVAERIKQKLANTYKKMGCIAAVECYRLILGEYNVELTNSQKLVVKVGQKTCICRQWKM